MFGSMDSALYKYFPPSFCFCIDNMIEYNEEYEIRCTLIADPQEKAKGSIQYIENVISNSYISSNECTSYK